MSNTLQTGLLVGAFTLIGSFLATLFLRWRDDAKAERLRKQELAGAVITVQQELSMNRAQLAAALRAFEALPSGPTLAQVSLSHAAYDRAALILAQQLPDSLQHRIGYAYESLRAADVLGEHRLAEIYAAVGGSAALERVAAEGGKRATLRAALDQVQKAEVGLRDWRAMEGKSSASSTLKRGYRTPRVPPGASG